MDENLEEQDLEQTDTSLNSAVSRKNKSGGASSNATGNEVTDSLDNDAVTDMVKDKVDEGKAYAKNQAKKEAKKAIKGLIKGDGFKIAKLAGMGKLILIIIAILWVCGLILALVFLPSLLGGGIVEGIEKILKGVNTRISGASGKINDKDVMALADYARSKGFQLYSDGFLFEKYTPKDLEEETYDENYGVSESLDNYKYIEEEGIMLDKEGQHVKKMKTKGSMLERYALMNAYTYTAEHEKNQLIQGIQDLWKSGSDFIASIFGKEKTMSGANTFTGMIRFEYSPWEADDSDDQKLKGQDVLDKVFGKDAEMPSGSILSTQKVKLDMEKKTLSIKYGLFDNAYVFNIDGWAGRYGMPTEFLLALHKSVMAPDLLYELTNGTKIEGNEYLKTKMLVRLIKAKGKVQGGFKIPDDTSINGKLYDSSHNEVKQENIDFEQIRRGDLVLYAKAGTPENPIYFPLKTTSGPVELDLPDADSIDKKTGVPDPNSEYDITDMYIAFENDPPNFRKINGYVVNAEAVKKYLKTTRISNNTKRKEKKKKGYTFLLNYGLQNLLMRYIDENGGLITNFTSDLQDAVKQITDANYKSFLPIIYKVENHWFRDVYFYMNEGQKYALIDEDEFIKKGEYWTKFKEKNSGKEKEVDYQTTDKVWSAYEIESVPLENRNLNFQTFEVDQEDPDMPESIKKLQKLGDLIQIKQNFNVRVKQTEDGRRGETNPRTKELFVDKSWYIYDGTEKTATEINKRRIEKEENNSEEDNLKRKLSKDMDLLAGSIMLENMESLDSEYAYRDYKELLLELDYYTVDDLSKRIRRVLTWPTPGVTVGKTWPDTLGVKDENDFGVKILNKQKVDELIKEKLKDESGNPLDGEDKKEALAKAEAMYGKGFEPGTNVISPVTGKIVKQDGNSIEIVALNNEDKVEQYKDFYEDEYKGGVAGYKIIIKNINVGIEDTSLYKPQISDSEIERLSKEEQRKKVKEKEDRKKNAPSRIGEYIKEGTVIGKTTDKEIIMYMNSIDDEIVEHLDKYLLVPYSNLRVEFLEDYLTKIIDGEPNQIGSGDTETFKKMFPEEYFPVINENADAFMEMQEMYEVNAIFAAAVSLAESSGGTNWGAIPKEYNNIFSITGSSKSEKVHHYDVGPSRPGSTNDNTWRKYKTVRDSILDFGRYIHNKYHSQNLDYVSEIGMNGYVGQEHGPEEAEAWVKTTNATITAALERYMDSDKKDNEKGKDKKKKKKSENSNESNYSTPVEADKVEEYERNPYDLLNLRKSSSSESYDGYSVGKYVKSEYRGEKEFINGFYYYNQLDKKWKNYTYKGSAISENACGPFSAAMAISAALGRAVDPIDMVRLSEERGTYTAGVGTDWSFFKHVSDEFNVPINVINLSEVDQKLDEGCVLIVSEGVGYWTRHGHFIVVVRKNPGGKTYDVIDPASRNRSITHSKERIFNTHKQIWAVGPTESIKEMQKGNIPEDN